MKPLESSLPYSSGLGMGNIMDWELYSGGNVRVLCRADSEAVRIAARNLVKDIEKVFSGDIHAELELGTTDDCGSDKGDKNSGKTVTIVISREELGRKEAYSHRVKDGVLYITGQDRRGMIYGVYELSRWLGVSPWYYFADVPVKRRDSAVLPDGYHYSDYPAVEYRGIFINDEEELDKWVRLHLGEETIGVRAYEKIFELLLRLRANYIWPAMHVNSFNLKRENGELADRMGIVVGTSHCDMLMRSNNREWYPWLKKKGYTDVEYDYSIPGRNRDALNEYWRESVEQNKDFEVGYTLGMRGIHDSGFETKSLKGLTGEELRKAKIELLQTIIGAQEKILADTLDDEPLKSFVPYKEVLELYDNGLEVPEDLTLIWTNDNYGYIRRYPGEKEKARKGGNGIYYHNSYWAPPGASYLFINSIPLAHTRNELYKAWCEGIRKVWVLNVGAIKPLEQEITFYLDFAWEAGKENPQRRTDDVDEYLKLWINETFSGNFGEKMARILNDFSQLTNVRKIELMDSDVFSQTAYGDEAAVRINRYRELVREADEVYEALPSEEKDAFFQLCLMKIHAAYYTNCMFYCADRSALCTKQGKGQAAYEYARICREYDDRRRKLIFYYNNVMADGKWSGILTPEDFPPPRTAMLPACVVPLAELRDIESRLVVTLWNDEESLDFVNGREKWLELANAGAGVLNVTAELPAWLEIAEDTKALSIEKHTHEGVDIHSGLYLSENAAYPVGFEVGAERRVLVKPCLSAIEGGGTGKNAGMLQGVIRLLCDATGQSVDIPVSVDNSATALIGKEASNGVTVEDGGAVVLEADGAGSISGTGWHRVKRLGRDHGCLLEACQDSEAGHKTESGVSYNFYIRKESENPVLELHRFPSLNSTGRIRAEVSIDGGERLLLESASNDEWRGNWKQNILDNVDKLAITLPSLGAGMHSLTIYPVDKYFAFSRMVIYTEPVKKSMFGGLSGDNTLPFEGKTTVGDEGNNHATNKASSLPVGDRLYGDIELKPRPMLVAGITPGSNTLPDTNTVVEWSYDVTEASRKITAAQLVKTADVPFAEENGAIRIDMAACLADNSNAYMRGKWEYCLSESYDGSGLAMYIREPGIKYDGDKPSLHYAIACEGGRYSLWILTKTESYDGAELLADIDGRILAAEQTGGGERLGNYCGERVYRWEKLWQQELGCGMHEIGIYTPSSANRFDRIYITKGDELPPTDNEWKKRLSNE